MTRWLRTRMRSLFRRRGVEHELDREIQFHLDMLAEQHVRAGMSPDAARRAALRSFGGVDRVKEDVRDTWLSRLFETLAQDVRYGARNLRRNPGFALRRRLDEFHRRRRIRDIVREPRVHDRLEGTNSLGRLEYLPICRFGSRRLAIREGDEFLGARSL